MAVHLLLGDDESILRSTAHDLVHRLLGDDDPSMAVEEFDDEDLQVAVVADAVRTPPLFTDRRVVVLRRVGRFTTEELVPLLEVLADPPPFCDLVLVAGGGRVAKRLTEAVSAADGQVVNTAPPSRPRDRQGWITERAVDHGVRLHPAAATRLADWLGEDVGRLDGIVATLVATYGPGERIGVDELEPFLGEAGGVPPWEFTDAIDSGKTTTALSMLHRMMRAGGRHPLQVMAVLHAHYARLARLDGVDARSEHDAAEAMGIRAGFPAKKAMTTIRRLGGDGVGRAIALLAEADLDLRGARELPDDVVMEVLVARLSRLGGVSSRR